MSERMSDERLDSFVQWERASYSPSEVQALAREVQERRKNDWANALADLRLSADMLAVRDLCARHGITVEGIVALVDDVMSDSVPTGRWDIYYLRCLARGEEA